MVCTRLSHIVRTGFYALDVAYSVLRCEPRAPLGEASPRLEHGRMFEQVPACERWVRPRAHMR
eukprot:542219-Pyramimonas_sp.AAC.1